MPSMVNPMDSLKDYQRAYLAGQVSPIPCTLHPNAMVFMDMPQGPSGPRRFSYTLMEAGKVIALAILVPGQPIDGVPCFDLGYAVDESHRSRGLAKLIVIVAMEEMQHGLARQEIFEFCVEAVVGVKNMSSQKVAQQVVQQAPMEITDAYSGEPALRYLKRIKTNASPE